MRAEIRTFTVSPWQQRLLLQKAVFWKLVGVKGFALLLKKHHTVVVTVALVLVAGFSFSLWLTSQNPSAIAGSPPLAESWNLSQEEGARLSFEYEKIMQTYLPDSSNSAALLVRTAEVRKFLHAYSSPLEPYAGVIAEQPHWRLILAISFAESGLGKNCVDNNCSGIGVAPGHELWREYASMGEWAKDLNKLLEKRYQNKTLRQMCGVYVQPCNPNWMAATTQIMQKLSVRNIP